jgi:tRNA threonylcarbamoyladenosine biosynthesis protein TsaE
MSWKLPEDFLINLVSNSPEETFALGQNIAAIISHTTNADSFVIALKGTLGSGKTCLAKGIANGLGINELLTSPTYTIINEYKCGPSPTLYHIDAYRLNDDKDFEELGGIEIINSGGISVIEWSERIPKSIPQEAITIAIEITGSSSRSIRITGLLTSDECQFTEKQ